MSRSARITLDWADGTYEFRLAWDQLIALQEACDAGPGRILDRLADRSWRVQDVEQVLFLGLTGAGMERAQARRLVGTYLRGQEIALTENIVVAQAVLGAALHGAPDEEPDDMGKTAAAAPNSLPSPGES